MKKLFTILAVASMMLTSVFGFSSCTNDDSDFNRATQQQPSLQSQQTAKQDAYLYTVASSEQSDYLDVVYVVNVDGQNKEISQSQMTLADNSEFSSAAQLVEAFDSIDSQVEPRIYKYNLGAVCSAKFVSVKGKALVDKSDHDITVAYGYTINMGKNTNDSKADAQVFEGVDDIKDFVETIHL